MELLQDNYKESNVFSEEGNRVMVSTLKPSFDLEKKLISFPKIALATGLLDEYVCGELEIHVMLHDQEEADIVIFGCKLMSFGYLTFVKMPEQTFALVNTMVFKYTDILLSEDAEELLPMEAPEPEVSHSGSISMLENMEPYPE